MALVMASVKSTTVSSKTALARFGDGVGDFGDAVVGDGIGDVGDDVIGDGFGEVGVGILVGAYVGAGVGVGAGAPGDVRAASSTEESRCVRVTTRRSDWARAAQSSHARFPIDIIGPLLREGTLSVGCSGRTLVERSLNGGFRRVVAIRGSVAVSAVTSVTASAAASAKALVALTWGLQSATLSVLTPVLM